MLATKFCFHGHGALRFLFGHGHTHRFKLLSIRVATNSRRTHSRFAVVVSKKVIKASPKRNRVRRRVYEILRSNWGHIAGGQDVIITVHDPAVWDMPHESLEAELVHVLKQIKLWHDTPTAN